MNVIPEKLEESAIAHWIYSLAHYVRHAMGSRANAIVRLDAGRTLAIEHVYGVLGGTMLLMGRLDDGSELHLVAAPETLTLELTPTPEGSLCTGFALLGTSRTPKVVLARRDDSPRVKQLHHH